MLIHVNDEPRDLPDGTTCRDLVADLTGQEVGEDGRAAGGGPLGIALAVDGEVVPRSAWAAAPLAAGAKVEVVTAVQGG